MAKRLFLLILLLGVNLSNGFSQAKVLNKDEAEAVRVARVFSRSVQRSKDVTPLIHTFFVHDFGQNLKKTKDLLESEFLPSEIATMAAPNLLRRFYIGSFHMSYLGLIWGISQKSIDSTDDDSVSFFPPDVIRTLRKDPFFSKMVREEPNKEKDVKITNIQQLRKSIRILEQVAVLYRKHLTQFPNVKTKLYRDYIAYMENRFGSLYKPRTITCNEENGCLGIAKGSKYFEITIEPYYILIMTKTKGRMKIAYVMPFIE